MGLGLWKKIGKIYIVLICFFWLPSLGWGALELETIFNNNKVSLGETASIQFKISGTSSDVTPVKIPDIPGLEISYGGSQTSFQFVNGRSWRGIILTYHLLAARKGTYKIPPFIFEVNGQQLRSKEVSLLVIKGAASVPSSNARGSSIGYLKSHLSFNKESLFVGEPIIMRYYLLSHGLKGIRLEGIEKQPEVKGFVSQEVKESIDEEIVLVDELEYVKSHLYTFVLIPAETGEHSIGGGSIVVSYNVSRGFFARSQQKRIIYDNQKIKIYPLPQENKPYKFQGDVGKFTLEHNFNPTQMNAYEEKRVIMNIRGEGNFLSITKPFFEKENSDVKILFEDGESKVSLQGDKLVGVKQYICTIIPEKSGSLNLGKIEFSFFNPDLKKYETVKTENFILTVKGELDHNKGLSFDEKKEESLDFNFFYIFLIILLVVGGVILVIVWEKRRYSFVQEVDEKQDEKETVVVSEKGWDDYLEEMKKFLKKEEYRKFLGEAEKALNYIKDKKDLGKIEALKKKIDTYRFGGAVLTEEEIKGLFEELKLI